MMRSTLRSRVGHSVACLAACFVFTACGGGAPGEEASLEVAATLTQRAIESTQPTEEPTPDVTATSPTTETPTPVASTATPPPTSTASPATPTPTLTATPELTETPIPLPTPESEPLWVEVNGEPVYLIGVNLPWISYGNDFGSNSWGAYGVHSEGTARQVDAEFERLAQAGANSVRWFIFGDGRAGIEYDDRGFPLRLDPLVFDDMDAALEIATRHGLLINFVLLDFHYLFDARFEDGVQLGGRSASISSAAGRAAIIDNLFIPLFDRYGNHPQILSWEIMNEPEWAISGDGGDPVPEVGSPVTLEAFQSFVNDASAAVHDRTSAQATVGGASMEWIGNWTDVGLDYLQVHYYDWMSGLPDHDLYSRKALALNVEVPVVVGEFPAEASETATLQEYLTTWFANGYAGAWVWSSFGGGDSGSPDVDVVQTWISETQLLEATP